MWKPGQIVTINGVVYRICCISRDIPSCYSCDLCTFSAQSCCTLAYDQSKYEDCMKLIPNDCYFKKIKPKS